MAYISPQDDDELDPESQAAQQRRLQESDPQTSGGASLFGSGPTASAGPTNGNPAPRSNSSGTGYVNLSAYAAANAGAGSAMGQKIADSIDQKANSAQSQVNNLSTDFNKQVQANTINFDQGAVSKDIGAALNQKAGGTYDNADVQDFSKYAGASFGGPSDFTETPGFGAASQAVSGAENDLSATQSEAGRQGLLRQTYGSSSPNGYTQGESTLDQALTETDPSAQKALSGVQQKWAGISQLLNNAANTAGNQVSAARATDQATADAARDMLGSFSNYTPSTTPGAAGTVSGGSGALGAWSGDIYNQGDAASKTYTDALASLKDDASKNAYTPDELSRLGLKAGQNTYGVAMDPKYIQAGLAPTIANAASADQYSQMAALEQLANVLPNGAGTAGLAPLNAADVAQAGTGAGIGTNAMYTLSPTWASDVQAAEYGVPAAIAAALNDHPTFSQNTYSASGFDPANQTFNLSTSGNYGPTTSGTYSLNPSDPNYIGNNTAALSPVTEDAFGNRVTNSIASTPAWQSLMGILNGTIQAAPTTANGAQTPVTTPIPVGAHFAHGGMVPSPIKEPHLPKPLKADYSLPKLPHLAGFAQGGAVKYPVHSEEAAREALERVNREGSDAEKKIVARVAHAKYPHLANTGTTAPTVSSSVQAPHPAPKPMAAPAAARYPMRTPEEARDSLKKVEQVGTPSEREIVTRQVRAHFPELQKELEWRGVGSMLQHRGQVNLPPVKADLGDALKAGGQVPGKPVVNHNSYKNDSNLAALSSGEIVLPLSVTRAADPERAAAEFVRETLAKKRGRVAG